MLGDHGIQIDREAVEEILNTADVLVVGFALFSERLLIDTRTNAETGPMVAIVEPLGGVQERYHWLGVHRGMFGMPEAFSFFAWPNTIRMLEEEDILGTIRKRLAATSNDGAETLDRAIARLRDMEKQAIRGAIRGDAPWKSLWQAA
ncbi:MAG: hypothetical protein KC482_10545 [Dehalococcoidia bacterium]|nr:hypothetical protein [Dehalococcoidia bacterium]MCA9826023.1 hypothetical protein [Dehalococcoidia bacterium]MCA9845518.1 hypothetical protein [Dehalococcoidia bacterium]MCA9854013.1 hypothetical protein [Dehalococcoidia bacterium]